jgi:hypothetical protein
VSSYRSGMRTAFTNQIRSYPAGSRGRESAGLQKERTKGDVLNARPFV